MDKNIIKISNEDELRSFLAINKGWILNNNKLESEFVFGQYLESISFVDKIALIFENYSHHADLSIKWGRVGVSLWTHDQNSLTELDLIIANEVQKLYDSVCWKFKE